MVSFSFLLDNNPRHCLHTKSHLAIIIFSLRTNSNAQFQSLVFKTGMKLPGSKTDVVRIKSLSGPSPVGGSMGGYESKNSVALDEFELQAANYNMACAFSQLGQTAEAVGALAAAFENGFDNFATVRADPDLDAVKGTAEFDKLMEKYEPKTKGFNPFGLFGGK